VLDQIQALAQTLAPRLVDIRRHFHAHPELSGHEHQTAVYIAGVLSSSGLQVQESVGRTGVVGELAGTDGDARRVAVRTDMDALPIEEKTGLTFASKQPGIMHACGHDLHATIGLGTAMVLAELAAQGSPLPGTVRFLFQPAEEIAQGAQWMIKAGCLDQVSAIFGIHCFPSIPVGQIGIRAGALTAAADDLEITILGEGGMGPVPMRRSMLFGLRLR
jgi:amidohydrolase